MHQNIKEALHSETSSRCIFSGCTLSHMAFILQHIAPSCSPASALKLVGLQVTTLIWASTSWRSPDPAAPVMMRQRWPSSWVSWRQTLASADPWTSVTCPGLCEAKGLSAAAEDHGKANRSQLHMSCQVEILGWIIPVVPISKGDLFLYMYKYTLFLCFNVFTLQKSCSCSNILYADCN